MKPPIDKLSIGGFAENLLENIKIYLRSIEVYQFILNF